MKYKKLDVNKVYVPNDIYVSVKEMGNVVEVVYNSNRNSKPQVLKLNEKEYLHLKSGEIKEYQKKSENRSECIESVRKTMKKVKDLIQTNVTDVSKVRWCTLTYKENQKDTKVLYDDFRKFNQRFQHYINKEFDQSAEYIAVAEPQGRGAWHMHVLYIFPEKAPYIANDQFSKIWNLGFTSIKKLDGVTNIAVYLMAYLSDMEIDESNKKLFDEKDINEVEIDGSKKCFVKGARLSMYPAGFNIIRHSRGIKYPKVKRMSNEDAMKLVEDKELNYHVAYNLSNDEGYSTVIDRKEFK